MNNYFSEGYGIIPKKVMRDKSISVYAKAVLAYMLSYTGGGRVECWPSIDTMAVDLCVARGSVIKAIEQLGGRRYITKSRLYPNDPLKRSNKYTLEWLYGTEVHHVNSRNPPGEITVSTERTLEVPPVDASINTLSNNKENSKSTPEGAPTTPLKNIFQEKYLEITKTEFRWSGACATQLKRLYTEYGEEDLRGAINAWFSDEWRKGVGLEFLAFVRACQQMVAKSKGAYKEKPKGSGKPDATDASRFDKMKKEYAQ